ncbi:Tryptophan synthase alpha chain [hydrothermal vent metagenome]|uniref:tryptophan synthase n=1 Tax=hydrothermal vent metagenome TaxID=652676 RepID=A0A3B1AI57_9ZZZZ
MSRIKGRFAELKQRGRKALIPYLTAGDPEPGFTVPLMHAMVKAGADILELGVPFSDPMAEGPVIQHAMERALEHHVSLQDVIGMVKSFRETDKDTPVLLMGYLNPIEVTGYEKFVTQAVEAGIDGVLLVDLPPEEAAELSGFARGKLDTVFLVAPTTTDQRIERISQASSGFVYYVSLKGVTGAGHLDTKQVTAKVQKIKQHTDLPVGVGFGIKDADTARQIAAVADAVIVGSALVKLIEANKASQDDAILAVSELITSMRKGMDANSNSSAA